MTVLIFTILVCVGSFLAGFLGALTGLGGGVVLVPLLALLFKVDMRYAMGASLVSVIATSSGAAAAYVREGYSNIRIGMFLEIATTIGAIVGALLAQRVSVSHPGGDFRGHAVVLRLCFGPGEERPPGNLVGPLGARAAHEWHLPGRESAAGVLGDQRPDRIRADVRGGHALGIAGHRLAAR